MSKLDPRRTCSFTFRCSAEELGILERAAEEDDRSLASFVRKLISAEAARISGARRKNMKRPRSREAVTT
jgi:uncharacterized protein (DUF1778 family)